MGELKYDYLVKHLDVMAVLPKLVTKGLVGADYHQKLQGKTQGEQVQELLTVIRRSPDNWFEKFTEALDEGSQPCKIIAKNLREGT